MALVLSILMLIVGSYFIIKPYGKYVVSAGEAPHMNVGLVLGAGINKQGKPYKELQARLDVAADALNNKTVKELLLSGDNRFKNYDEPTAMRDYLVKNRGIKSSKLVLDYAGRSTYESCERANKIFGLEKVIIFSARSHLPRAIYLCRHFGIESFGISSQLEANNSTRRELLARVKAILNVNLWGPKTVLGTPIPIQ